MKCASEKLRKLNKYVKLILFFNVFYVRFFFCSSLLFPKSESGAVYRYCSNHTLENDVPIDTFTCTIKTVYNTGNSRQFTVDVSDICEACNDSEGGCNGASQYGPVAVMIAIPMAIIKILAF